jgi:hypothetical protein
MGRPLEREVHRHRHHAWKLRQKGYTFGEIGQMLGITEQGARQLVAKFEGDLKKWEAEGAAGSLLYHLHVVAIEKGHAMGVETRVRNCLQATFGQEALLRKGLAEELAQLGRRNLLRIRGMGLQGVELLAEALQEMGFALQEEGERWFPPLPEPAAQRPPSEGPVG